LKPEKSSTQEAGLQAALLESKVEFTIAAYNRDSKDVIVYGATTYENRDKQHDYGGELDASYAVSKNMNIKISYAYVDGNITQKLAGKDTTYYNLIRRPRHNAHLFISYRATKNLFITSSLQITGKRTDTYFDPVSFLSSQVDLKTYVLWNAYAEYAFLDKKLHVFADVKNITNNKDYYEVYGYSVQGVNITAGIRFKL